MEEYVNARTPILHRFNCGHINNVRPYSILNGSGCDICNRKNVGKRTKKTTEVFINELYKINKTIKVIGKYENANQPIQVQCSICKYKWNPLAGSLINSKHANGCPKCAGQIVTPLDFYKKFEKYGDNNIVLTGEYINSHTKIKGYCNVCGYDIQMYPYQLVKGVGCKKCKSLAFGQTLKKTHEQFINDLLSVNPYIKITSSYKGIDKQIDCECLVCTHKWQARAGNLIHEQAGCPVCNMSHGERLVQIYLDKYNITYIHPIKFEDLRGIGNRKLSYDFYLPDYNLLIECQGKQHKEAIEYFGGKEKFEVQQEHDRRKREYANKYNIPLLEIWYYDIDNTENILKETLNNLKLESLTTAG